MYSHAKRLSWARDIFKHSRTYSPAHDGMQYSDMGLDVVTHNNNSTAYKNVVS